MVVAAVNSAPGGRARIVRISGPLVEIDNAGAVAMHDMLALGAAGVPGEVVGVRQGVATAQAYEYTGGLAPGDAVATAGRPLRSGSARTCSARCSTACCVRSPPPATFLSGRFDAATGDRAWDFRPGMRVGDRVAPGAVLGVLGSGPVQHRVLADPTVGGSLEHIAEPGRYREHDELARVSGAAVRVSQLWPVRRPRPYRSRHTEVEPLHTGQRALDLLFPLPRGGTAAVPGGFGTGKTMLLQQIAKWCDADVIVYVGCGERGNELAEVVADLSELGDPRTGGRLLDRTVMIANTSNMPMMAREASIHTGITVAEYFRDMGHHAVVIADSTSRWAEAMREFASRTGAMPTEEGYPAELASTLAAFYERAGLVETLGGHTGSVTVIGAVSPPGGDLTEPVTVYTERFVRCRWTLDRELAYARHYPAVSWSGSFARDVEAIAAWHARSGDEAWALRRGRIVGLLAEADRLAALADLVGVAALPGARAGRAARGPAGARDRPAAELAVGQRRLLHRGEGGRAGRGPDLDRRRAARRGRGGSSRGRSGTGGLLAAVARAGGGHPRTVPASYSPAATPCSPGSGTRRDDPADAVRLHLRARAARPAGHRCGRRSGGLGRVRPHPAGVRGGAPWPGARGRPRSCRGRGAAGHRRHVHGRHRGGVHREPAAHPGRARLARPHLQRPGRAARRRPARSRARHRSGRRTADQPGASGGADRAGDDRRLGGRRAHHAGPRPEASDLLRAGPSPPRAGDADRGPGAGDR